MKINRLKITGLYGYINKDITFNQDLTLLVGINGSGKTSILNIISWILKPSIPYLCMTEFKIIQLYFQYKETKYEIECKHNRATFKYTISNDKEKFNPLIVRTTKNHVRDIRNDENLRLSLMQHYSSLKPDQKEQKTWELISTFPHPTVIGLDRNLFPEESERLYFEESVKGRLLKKVIKIL